MNDQIRKEMKKKRLALSKDEVKERSLLISEKIKELNCYKEAKIIGVYYPINNEIELYLDKTLCYPKIDGENMDFYIPDEFVKGPFNLLEPLGKKIDKKDIDIIFVPMLACSGLNRLGYKRGYYDRYLKDYKGLKIGVCYSFQEVEEIKTHQYDVSLDMIIKGWFKWLVSLF